MPHRATATLVRYDADSAQGHPILPGAQGFKPSWSGAGTDLQHQERATVKYPCGLIQFSQPLLFFVTPPRQSGTSHKGLSVSTPNTGRVDLH